MILRHVTLTRNLPSIIREGALNSSCNKRKSDQGYISFELNPESDVLVRRYTQLKSNPIADYSNEEAFELLFDGERILAAGLEIVSEFPSRFGNFMVKMDKSELKGVLSEEEVEKIGEYKFIHGRVSLEYLTVESKTKLDQWISVNL